MAKSKRKNPAAVALGKLGGKEGVKNPAKGHPTAIARGAHPRIWLWLPDYLPPGPIGRMGGTGVCHLGGNKRIPLNQLARVGRSSAGRPREAVGCC